MHYRHPGFLKTFGSRLGAGLADELLDRWFPPAPSFLQGFAQAFVDQAPTIVSMIQYYIYTKSRPPERAEASADGRDPAVVGVGVVGWAPGCAPLGEFTCPKCGGHTWNTMGPLTSPVVERYCTNGTLTCYGPGMDPNTVTEPCRFRWKSTEDHLCFAKPSADDVRRATETQVCVPPDFPKCVPVESHGDRRLHETEAANQRNALMNQGTPRVAVNHDGIKEFRVRDIKNENRYGWGRRVLGPDATVEMVLYFDSGEGVEVTAVGHDGKKLGVTRFFSPVDEASLGDAGKRLGIKSARERVGLPPTNDADKRYRSPIQIAVGERVGPGETTEEAAARLLAEADEFIRAQSDKIADLTLDNVFPAGKGEVGFMLSEATAKKLGLAYQPGAKPIRVSLVLDGWQWAVRLGLGRVGGELIRVDWDVAMEIMRGAKDAAASAQQEMVAQNAAGGVA